MFRIFAISAVNECKKFFIFSNKNWNSVNKPNSKESWTSNRAKKFLKKIIFYVLCNPTTFVINLKFLEMFKTAVGLSERE